MLEQLIGCTPDAAVPGTKRAVRLRADQGGIRSDAGHNSKSWKKIPANMVRDAKRIELEREISRLESQVEISTRAVGRLRKRSREETATRPTPWAAVRSPHKCSGPRSITSNGSSAAWPKSGNASAWNSSRQPRVNVLGDQNAPAAVPENEATFVSASCSSSPDRCWPCSCRPWASSCGISARSESIPRTTCRNG